MMFEQAAVLEMQKENGILKAENERLKHNCEQVTLSHTHLYEENERLKYGLGQSLIKITKLDNEIKALKQ